MLIVATFLSSWFCLRSIASDNPAWILYSRDWTSSGWTNTLTESIANAFVILTEALKQTIMSALAMVDGMHLVQPVSELSNGPGDSKSNVSQVSEQSKTTVDEQKHCNQAISAGEDPKPNQGSILAEKKYTQDPWDSRRESVN